MKIYFVRHGHPNYKNDCLTSLGHLQAEAAAERLCAFGIEEIYTSTCGRALETAEHTSSKLGLRSIPCEFMREIHWKAIDPENEPIPLNGHPWELVRLHSNQGFDLTAKNWSELFPYSKSKMVSTTQTVTQGFDAWLSALGYEREGDYYRVTTQSTNKTVAMFSHGGSSSAAMSHMFNIPFPQFCGAFHLDFTSITLVELDGERGECVYPKFIYVGDSTHIVGLE